MMLDSRVGTLEKMLVKWSDAQCCSGKYLDAAPISGECGNGLVFIHKMKLTRTPRNVQTLSWLQMFCIG